MGKLREQRLAAEAKATSDPKLKPKRGQGEAMKRNRRLEGPRVRKRSISIGGHKTSISLEDEFWQALGEIALVRDLSISKLVATIDEQRQYDNLCSAIWLFVLDFFQNATDELATWRKG